MKKKTYSFLILLSIILVAGGMTARRIYERYYSVTYLPVTTKPTADRLSNPYQGWYHIYGYTLSDTQEPALSNITSSNAAQSPLQLALLEINLKNYRTCPISDTGLAQLDKLFDTWADTGKQLIVRFLYDWDGRAKETEPDDFSTIKTHMAQTADSVNSHKNCIYLLQGIFVGNCGEMNNSNYMSKEHMTQLIQTLSGVIDSDIFLSVRTPAHWRTAAQSYLPLAKGDAFCGSLPARLGLFNDGMLGSGNDLGTYGDTSLSLADDFSDKGTREEEINFQNTLCRYVPNGGEVVLDNPYNDFYAATRDLSQMHVSYLNCDYDSAVLDKWRASLWESEDCFNGVNGFDYIGNHLGYRYSLLSSSCSFDTWKDDTALLTLTIENSGFANSLKYFSSAVTLLPETGESPTVLPLAEDNRFWDSGNSVSFSVQLPVRNIGQGSFRICYSLTDSVTGRQIQLANDLPQSEYGYEIGSLTICK